MRALITGAEGFVGTHLYSFLKGKPGIEVMGTFYAGNFDEAGTFFLDITSKEDVARVIKDANPDAVFHLAGFSSVGGSFTEPEKCHLVNVGGTKNLFDGCIAAGSSPRILVVGSAEVYGVPTSIPITETHATIPVSPYGTSRLEQETLCRSYIQKHGMKAILTRSFNHTGPGQPDTFVISSFARQVVSCSSSKDKKTILTGNLEPIRDFTDVRDVIEAYFLLCEKGVVGEIYNVCSGKGYKIQDLLDKLISIAGTNVEIAVDRARYRPIDIPVLVGDNRKLYNATGWEPKIPIEKTLTNLLEYWRLKFRGQDSR